jgi:hypothetical protein
MKYFIYILFILAFILRLVRLIPNLELVTTAMLLSGLYLSRSISLKLTLFLMAATDLILGNTLIFIFTWTGFLFPVLLISKSNSNHHPSIVKATGFGVLSNIFFFIWTNFGVWLLDSWGMYSKSLPGLFQCYVNGLPFLKTQLESTLLFVPLCIYLLHFITRQRIILDTSRETLFLSRS